MIDLRAVYIFLTVAEAGSFTTAAKHLNKTQSAVSQAIRQLEDNLGVVLINRASRHLSLTPTGELLRIHGRRLVEDVGNLETAVREQGRAKLNDLRMGLVDSFAAAVGPVLIKSLLEEAVNLSLFSDLTPRLGAALFAGDVDIIVANDSFDERDALTRYELMREPYILLLPKSGSWATEDPDIAQLARNCPIIRYHSTSFMASQIESQFRRMNVQVSRRISVDSTDKLLAMIAAGIGWGVSTPASLLRAKGYIDDIVALPFPGPSFHRQLFLMSRRGELDTLLRRLAITSRQVLSKNIIEELGQRFPWLRDQISVPPFDEVELGMAPSR